MHGAEPGYVFCPHASECAGCPSIGQPEREQLARKRERVEEAVHRHPLLQDVELAPPVPAVPSVGYRTRAKLVVEGSKLGLFAQRSHAVVDIPGCRVLSPELMAVAQGLRDSLPQPDWLSAVDLRRVQGGVLAGLVVTEGTPESALQELAARVAELRGVLGVSVSLRRARSPLVLGRRARVISGPSAVPDAEAAGVPYALAGHGTFVQAHAGQAEALRAAIVDALGGPAALAGARVLELYAGTGALALRLAAIGARVTAVEASAPAAELAGRAAREQSLPLQVTLDDASRATRALSEAAARFDAVVVNPPRAGLPPELRRALAALRPEILAYVSCCPETLARDLAHLALLGLGPRGVTPYDMIPLSDQVEALALLAPCSIAVPTVLHSDEQLIAVEKLGHEPTTPQGEHAGSLLERVRRLPGADEAVPVHRLDSGTSGVCLFARRAELARALADALAAGQKEYVALVRGIARPKGSVARPLPVAGALREARTRYRRLELVAGHSLLSVSPVQGRKHQVRRHLAGIGHPVLGDARYGDPASNRHLELGHGLDRLFLHCGAVELAVGGRSLKLTSPLAPDLATVLESLRSASRNA